MTYDSFLSTKQIKAEAAGFDVMPEYINDKLFPWQQRIVRWALNRGRAALFADTGLGKSAMQLEWARHVVKQTGRDVLILAPLAVAAQTVREGEKFGIPVRRAMDGSEVEPGITITNYERLHRFTPDRFGGIVLDECFAPDTLIDTPTGARPICEIRPGDEIINAAGVDIVADIHRREVPYAVRATINGRAIVCSPNHPFFTRRGWVGAQDLEPGDEAVATSEAVRMVRQALHGALCAGREETILRSVLLSEMADEAARAHSEGAHARGRSEARREAPAMAGVGRSEGEGGNRAGAGAQSFHAPGGTGEDLPPIESHEPRTFRAWGQWPWLDRAATADAGCIGRRLDGGIRFVTGQADSRLSHLLQSRLGEYRAQSRYRSGWEYPLQPQAPRCKEGHEARFARVDRLEVLESGHPDVARFRDADGKLYFYDLGATRHPSFSVAGNLVHNSSILKSFSGKVRKDITAFARHIPYRLACTATPAPNDLIEITNHAEFLDILSGKEIIALFFRQDGNSTHDWRLRGHAREAFWRWLASWAVALRSPADLGEPDDGFLLPPLSVHDTIVEVDTLERGTLVPVAPTSRQDELRERRATLDARVQAVADLVNAEPDEPWLVWCELNDESKALAAAIPGAVEIKGADNPEDKEAALLGFATGDIRVLVTKPSIAGHGMNYQHCARMAFVGISHSFEQTYQAIRRCYRYGQQRPVHVHFVAAETQGRITANVLRKEREHNELFDQLARYNTIRNEEAAMERTETPYETGTASGEHWTLMLGDCVERIREVESESVGLSVFSPPFPGMYAYTDSPRDMGNVKSIDEMIKHFGYLIPELYRVTMPGRSCAIHLTQSAMFKGTDGYMGLKDFRGRVIAAMEEHGWYYHAETTIEKNPQMEAVRNKTAGLLFKSLATDASIMRMAMADYLLVFRKPGENPVPIRAGYSERYNNPDGWITEQEWIEWASPVWFRWRNGRDGGIRETDVLNVAIARDDDDERHLCPLQLGVIERVVKLWSAPGDLVLSPFAGVGSEGYEAIRLGRRFTGIELKESYWRVAQDYLRQAEQARASASATLFDVAEVVA